MANRERAAADLKEMAESLAGQEDQKPEQARQQMDVDEAGGPTVPDTHVGSIMGSGNKAQRKKLERRRWLCYTGKVSKPGKEE